MKPRNLVPLEIATLSVQPGDVVIIATPWSMSRADQDDLLQRMRHAFPDNEVIIMHSGATVQVIHAS